LKQFFFMQVEMLLGVKHFTKYQHRYICSRTVAGVLKARNSFWYIVYTLNWICLWLYYFSESQNITHNHEDY
jgi:hypothetical protein